MRYILYLFTMAVLFVGGMLVGNNFLPTQEESLASAVSVPSLNVDNTVLQSITREQAQQDLAVLAQLVQQENSLSTDTNTYLLNRISLRLAIENFEFKKTKLELEIAKNNKNNRPTTQLTHAVEEYNLAREQVEKLAQAFVPNPQVEEIIKSISSPTPTDKK